MGCGMKLTTWTQITSYEGEAIYHPSRTQVEGLEAMDLLHIKKDSRGRITLDSDALESAFRTFERGIEAARDRGIVCGRGRPSRAMARAGIVAAGLALNSRAARRVRQADSTDARQRQLLLPLVADGLGRAGK